MTIFQRHIVRMGYSTVTKILTGTIGNIDFTIFSRKVTTQIFQFICPVKFGAV